MSSLGVLCLELQQSRKAREGVLSVEVHSKPAITIRYSRMANDRRTKITYELTCPRQAWSSWAREAAAEWWAVSAPEIKVSKDGRDVPGRLLAYAPNLVWQGDDAAIYYHSGPPRIYWMDDDGVYDWEPISTVHGGAFAVVSQRPLCASDRAWLRTFMLVAHPADWALPASSHDSTSLPSQLAIADCLPGGVARPLVTRTASWLRSVLPAYKVGAPNLDDVQLKLSLEKRLRIEDHVMGSVRPLAFTLEAVDDSTFAWPGLWLHSGSMEDFRADLSVLLAWDATLAAVAAVARLHVDVKPGLWYGPGFSQSLYNLERRFSKRDIGLTTASYSQVNPGRIVGPAPVVASRLLQAATHELAHLNMGELQPHSEVFVARREQLFLTATELLPALIELVQALSLDLRPSRTIPVPPIALDQWLHEALVMRRLVPITHLAAAWAAVRNLTEGRADRDVREGLAQLQLLGRCAVDDTGTHAHFVAMV